MCILTILEVVEKPIKHVLISKCIWTQNSVQRVKSGYIAGIYLGYGHYTCEAKIIGE